MRSAIHVRPAIDSDWRQMAECFKDAGKAAWTFLPSEVLANLIPAERWQVAVYRNQLEPSVLVAESEGLLIGFAVLRPSGDEDAKRGIGEVDAFYTSPRFWGRGAGQALMKAVIELAHERKFDRLTLWTEERNQRSRRFYELFGWRPEGGIRKRPLGESEIVELRYHLEI